jgi:hypothetical protein
VRCQAVVGAHITHMLRDMLEDIPAGYVNIPAEYLEIHNIDLRDINREQLREWVKERLQLARANFTAGKRYIDSLEVLRCKLAGYCYCARFEHILETIEKDGYLLRPDYEELKGMAAWVDMARLALAVTVKHITRRYGRGIHHKTAGSVSAPGMSKRSMQIE